MARAFSHVSVHLYIQKSSVIGNTILAKVEKFRFHETLGQLSYVSCICTGLIAVSLRIIVEL